MLFRVVFPPLSSSSGSSSTPAVLTVFFVNLLMILFVVAVVGVFISVPSLTIFHQNVYFLLTNDEKRLITLF